MLRIALQRNFADCSALIRRRAGGGITCLQIITQALQLDKDTLTAVDVLDLTLFAELADAEDSQTRSFSRLLDSDHRREDDGLVVDFVHNGAPFCAIAVRITDIIFAYYTSGI